MPPASVTMRGSNTISDTIPEQHRHFGALGGHDGGGGEGGSAGALYERFADAGANTSA